MKKFLATLVLSLSLTLPLSAFAFLGMNAGATLQGPLPAWTKQLGARLRRVTTYSVAVATDPSKNIIEAGYTLGDLDGNTLAGTQDFFVTKYDSTGTKLWTRQLGVASKTTYAYGVTTDSSGNIFVAGYTTGGLDGNTLTGTQDFFVTKYDTTGAKQWTRQLGVASQTTYASGITTDSSGNIFVTGYTTGGLDGNTLTGTQDLFVTKYDSTGAKQWTRQLGVASAFTEASGVTSDSSGNIFVAGSTGGGLDGNTRTGTNDFFVTKYDTTGAKKWTRQLGVASVYTDGKGVTTDSSGNIFVAGYTSGGLDGNTLAGIEDFFVTKYDSTGAKQWTRQLGVASALTEASGVTTDSSGNIFVAGYTSGGLDGNTLTGTQDFFVTKYDTTGAKQWTRQLGVASQNTNGSGVTTDTSGNIFVAGYTLGGLDGNTLTGSRDSFITKYDSTGIKQWTKQNGCLGPSNISASSAAVDSSGNLYISGQTDSGLDGNTQTGPIDFFVTKYDFTGVKKWTKQLGATGGTTNSYAVAADLSGNVLVAGSTGGALDGNLLGGPIPATRDFFVTKYDSTGSKLWTRVLGVSGKTTIGRGVATDSSGNVFVAGYTRGGLDGNALTGTQDFFVTKYDSTGAKQWTQQLGVASQLTYAYGVATDSSGNIFVAGYTTGGLDGNSLTGTQDFFVIKYDSTGTKQWTRQLGVASQPTFGNAIATDSSGNIFGAGYTTGGLDGNTLTGTKDFFVIKYDSTGTKQWTRQLGIASQSASGNAVATDSLGDIFVAGYTTGSLDGNSLRGTQDFFITKYTSTGLKQWTKQMGAVQGTTNAAGLAMHSSGRLYVIGTTTSGIDFNSQTGTTDSFACQYIGN